MEKWRYKSLEWIHKAREENYNKTKDLFPEELIERSRQETDSAIKSMGLKTIVRLKERVPTH
jgi:hypothetical protein